MSFGGVPSQDKEMGTFRVITWLFVWRGKVL